VLQSFFDSRCDDSIVSSGEKTSAQRPVKNRFSVNEFRDEMMTAFKPKRAGDVKSFNTNPQRKGRIDFANTR
jgi:hypothetical protein